MIDMWNKEVRLTFVFKNLKFDVSFCFSRRKNGFYPERMSIVYTRYKRPGDFDVLSSTVQRFKNGTARNKKTRWSMCGFLWHSEGQTFFFHRQTVCQKLSDGMFRRTTEGQQLGLFLLTVFGKKKIIVVTLSVHLSCIMLRTIRDRILNKNPKNSDTRKYCCNHFINWTIWIYLWVICPNNADRVANSVKHDDQSDLGLHFLLEWKTIRPWSDCLYNVDPDPTALMGQSDLGLHCLPRPVCPKLLIILICV